MIRKLRPKDAPAYRLLRLEALKAYPNYFGSGYEQQVLLNKLYFEQLIEEQSERGVMFGAFVDSNLVGICGVTFEAQRLPDAGEIIQMYVQPEYQHKGFGRQLMNAIEGYCRKGRAKNLVLEVIRANTSAINLYTQLGYRAPLVESDQSTPIEMILALI